MRAFRTNTVLTDVRLMLVVGLTSCREDEEKDKRSMTLPKESKQLNGVLNTATKVLSESDTGSSLKGVSHDRYKVLSE